MFENSKLYRNKKIKDYDFYVLNHTRNKRCYFLEGFWVLQVSKRLCSGKEELTVMNGQVKLWKEILGFDDEDIKRESKR